MERVITELETLTRISAADLRPGVAAEAFSELEALLDELSESSSMTPELASEIVGLVIDIAGELFYAAVPSEDV